MLLHPAFGDHQVATVTAEVEARTIGARTLRGSFEWPHRSRIASFPWRVLSVGQLPPPPTPQPRPHRTPPTRAQPSQHLIGGAFDLGRSCHSLLARGLGARVRRR